VSLRAQFVFDWVSDGYLLWPEHVVTFAKEVMHSPLSVCLSVC